MNVNSFEAHASTRLIVVVEDSETINQWEAERFIYCGRMKKSSGCDGILVEFYKSTMQRVCPIFLALFNTSLRLRYVPKLLRTSMVIHAPITVVASTNPSKYRPINLLPMRVKLKDKAYKIHEWRVVKWVT